MPVVEAHFFAPEDLNGPTIFECSSDDQFLKGIRLDIQRDKLGNGLVEFARRVPLGIFVNDIVQPEVFVRFLVPEISATDYLWGCFLDYRQQKVVSVKEKGGEGFRFGGPGPKFYLTRSVLWSASFAGYDNAVHREEHVWTWPESARAGAILNRLILEDQSNPSGPFLPDLTKSFSDANDSDGVPWAEDVASGADEFSLNIGDDYLKLLWTLENAGSLVTQMTLGSVGSPLMQLDAYQTFGRDLTGAIGASTVHFTEGVNILTDLDVEGASLRKASHALVRGADGVYELAVRPSWDSSQYRKVAFHVYENTDNNTWLDKAGVRFLQRQENGERQIKLRFQPGFDPASGLYMPGPDGTNGHLWVGDTVDLTTGAGSPTELDYSSDAQVVTGIQMELLKAVRDDSAEEAARSWKLTALLNYDRESNATVPAGGTTGGGTDTHRPGPVLCGRYLPAVAGDQPTVVDSNGVQGFQSSSDYIGLTVSGTDRAIYLLLIGPSAHAYTPTWYPDFVNAGSPGTGYALTEVERASGSSCDAIAYRLIAPVVSSTASSALQLNPGAPDLGGGTIAFAWALVDVDQTTPESDSAGNSGTGTASSVSVTAGAGDLILEVGGWGGLNNATVTTPTNTGDNVTDDIGTLDRSFGLPDWAAGFGRGDDATPSWGFTNSHPWAAVALAVAGTGGGSSSLAENVLNGTDGCAARGDHQHHWYSTAAPTVDDDDSLGFRVGTRWLQLDDLETPAEVVAAWVSTDVTDGAAVWIQETIAGSMSALPAVSIDTDAMSSWWTGPKAVEVEYEDVRYLLTSSVNAAGVTEHQVTRLADLDTTVFTLATLAGGVDDHNSAAILAPADKPRLLIYADHNEDAVLRWRKAAGNSPTSSLNTEDTFTVTGNQITYAQAYYRATDEVYIWTRVLVTGESSRYWTMVWSTDYLATAPSQQRVFDFGSGEQGYLTSTQLTDDPDVLRVALNGHPDTAVSTVHDIFVALVNLGTGEITKLDGTSLGNFKSGTSLPIVVASECDKAVDVSGTTTTRLLDVGDGDVFEVVYATGTEGDQSDWTYHLISYDGAAWNDSEITGTGDVIGDTADRHYLGGAVIPDGTAGRTVVLSRKSGATWYIERWTLGSSEWVSDQLTSSATTQARPFAVQGGTLIRQLWHSITAYTTFTDWAGGLVGVQDGESGTVVSASVAVNDLRWEPVVTDPGTGPELVFDGTGDIVMTWVDYG